MKRKSRAIWKWTRTGHGGVVSVRSAPHGRGARQAYPPGPHGSPMWRQATLRGDVRGTGLGAEEAPSPTSDDNLGKSMKPEAARLAPPPRRRRLLTKAAHPSAEMESEAEELSECARYGEEEEIKQVRARRRRRWLVAPAVAAAPLRRAAAALRGAALRCCPAPPDAAPAYQ